jgi:hypothetical protein
LSLVESIIVAAKRNDEDAVSYAIVQLDLSDLLLNKPLIPESVFDGMLHAFEGANDADSFCGFYVFEWFGSNYRRLTDPMRNAFDEYVANNYQSYSEPSVLISMAEWIGGQGNERALAIIDRWIELAENEAAFRHIDTAISEFLLFNEEPEPRLADELLRVRGKYQMVKQKRLGST